MKNVWFCESSCDRRFAIENVISIASDQWSMCTKFLRALCGSPKVLRRLARGLSCTGCTETLFLWVQLRAPWTHKPLSGFQRTLSGSQNVLKNQFGGLCAWGTQIIRFRRARFQTPSSANFLPSANSVERTQWFFLSLLFRCKSKLTEFVAEFNEFAAELGEFFLSKERVVRPFPNRNALQRKASTPDILSFA